MKIGMVAAKEGGEGCNENWEGVAMEIGGGCAGNWGWCRQKWGLVTGKLGFFFFFY